jgi:hypothetical protein
MNTEDKTQRILERLTIKALEEASDLILSLQIQVAQLERGVVPAQTPTGYTQYVRALAKLDFFSDHVCATHSVQPLHKTGETK